MKIEETPLPLVRTGETPLTADVFMDSPLLHNVMITIVSCRVHEWSLVSSTWDPVKLLVWRQQFLAIWRLFGGWWYISD